MASELVYVAAATHGDLDALGTLFAAYLEFYERPASERAARALVERRIEDGSTKFFVAFAGTTPAGFMHLLPAFDTLALGESWILQDLFVDPRFRRRGVASALMVHAERFARDTNRLRISLSTARTNETAQRIYEAHGYQRDDLFLTYERTLT